MITARVEHPDGHPVVLLGLTVEDVERLVRDEEPRVLNIKRKVDPTLPDVDVAIFFASAESVAAMRERYGHVETTEGEQGDNGNDNRGGDDRRRRGRRRRGGRA